MKVRNNEKYNISYRHIIDNLSFIFEIITSSHVYAILLACLVVGLINPVYAENSASKLESRYLQYNIGGMKHTFELPEDIYESKDCKRFFDWQVHNIVPIIEYKRCPWLDYKTLRKVTLGENIFAIPREFLSEISAIKNDGVEKNIVLELKYHSSKKPNDNVSNISVLVTDVKDELAKFNMNGREFIKEKYWPIHHYNEFANTKYETKFIGYDDSLEMEHFVIKAYIPTKAEDKNYTKNLYKKRGWDESRIDKFINDDPLTRPDYTKTHIYVKGKLEDPDLYISCDDDIHMRPHCKGAFVNNKILYEVFWPKNSLKHFKSIESMILNRMNEWEASKKK